MQPELVIKLRLVRAWNQGGQVRTQAPRRTMRVAEEYILDIRFIVSCPNESFGSQFKERYNRPIPVSQS